MFTLKLVTLTGVKFDETVYETVLPTMDGIIGVLPKHLPLVSVASPGVVKVRRNAKDSDRQLEIFAISGGVIKVEEDKLLLLVDEADHAEEISEAEAKEAHERALKAQANAKEDLSIEQAKALVDRTNARLEVASLKRHRSKH